jgi:heat shock protein HslJ
MRRFTLAALLLAMAAVAVACSGSGDSLTGKTWQLTSITEKVPASQGVVPEAEQSNYTIEFKSDDTFQAKADCNQVSGGYTTTSSGGMTITPGPTTLVACPEGSLGAQYVAGLGNTASYAIANSQLTLTLTDGGTLVFK